MSADTASAVVDTSQAEGTTTTATTTAASATAPEATVAAAAAAAAPATTTTPAAAAANTSSNTNQQQQQQQPTVVDFEPPTACVRRILKNTMPQSTNVGKDALAAFQRSVGIFIIYLTACSNDFARENRRQTITANDVLAAIQVSC